MTSITKQLAAVCGYENVTPEVRGFQSSASNGLVLDAKAEIERLQAPWRAVDSRDWEFLMGAIGDGGRGRFWKAVLSEMRGALEQKAGEAKRKMKTEEGLLKDKVKHYLGALPRVYWHMPVPSGYGAQTLDFLCCIDGRFCGIETKAKGKEPTPRQNKCIADIKAAGGAAFWCDSFESFMLNMAAWGLAPNA